MNLGRARLQKSGEQLELPYGEMGEAQQPDGSGEVLRATRGNERSGTGCLMEEVVEKANLKAALKRVRQNKGGPGIDAMTVGELPEHLKREWRRIREELLSGTYRPQPVKRQTIPKAGGGERELGIPTVLDRFIQQALLQVLQPRFDPDFSDHSYGFRPKRRAHQAIGRAQSYVQGGRRVVVDVDLAKFLDTSSHYPPICWIVVEEAHRSAQDLDFQSLTAARPDMSSLEFAALYTLQDRLSGDPEKACRVLHRDEALGDLIHETGAKLFSHADAPRCARCQLLSGDEAIVEPTEDRGWSKSEPFCDLIDGEERTFACGGPRLEASDLPVGPEAGDAGSGEGKSGRRLAALAIEDPGNHGVRIVLRKTADEAERFLAGTDGRRLWMEQDDVELAQQTAAPAQDEVRTQPLTINSDHDLFEGPVGVATAFCTGIAGSWFALTIVTVTSCGADAACGAAHNSLTE